MAKITPTTRVRRIINNPPTNPEIGGKDLSGDTYGNFLVLGFDHRDETSGSAWWKVKCTECGTIRVAHHSSVTGAPERCSCYKVYTNNPKHIYRIGEGLQQRIDEENRKLVPLKPLDFIPTSAITNTPKVFEFNVDSVKQAIIDLRDEYNAFHKATKDWRQFGISANRDMKAWHTDIDVREDNILFRILDMIEELQNEFKQKS